MPLVRAIERKSYQTLHFVQTPVKIATGAKFRDIERKTNAQQHTNTRTVNNNNNNNDNKPHQYGICTWTFAREIVRAAICTKINIILIKRKTLLKTKISVKLSARTLLPQTNKTKQIKSMQSKCADNGILIIQRNWCCFLWIW